MKIQPNFKIADLQTAFSKKFPGLKIEFYKKEHSTREGSHQKNQLDADTLLSELIGIKKSGEIDIRPEMTVEELESTFESDFGLHVQVFRRSAAIWLQTTTTDDWTLEVQNRKGIHSLEAVK